MLTTLTAAVVAPLADTDQFVVCVCNVGDSLAYVYSQKYGVREITQGSLRQCFGIHIFYVSLCLYVSTYILIVIFCFPCLFFIILN